MKFHKGVRPWVCPHEGCTKSFVLKQNLMDHVRRHKKVNLPYKCNTCQLTFADFTTMAEHRAQKHPDVVNATADFSPPLEDFGASDVLIGQQQREGGQAEGHQMVHIGEGLKGGESFMQHYELDGGGSTQAVTHNGWH